MVVKHGVYNYCILTVSVLCIIFPGNLSAELKDNRKLTVVYSSNRLASREKVTRVHHSTASVKSTHAQQTTHDKQKYITYHVKKGDTLYRIGKKFKTTVKQISTANRLRSTSRIFVGKKLKIPVNSATYSSNTTRNTTRMFSWPVSHIYRAVPDGKKGVRSIGLEITIPSNERVRTVATGNVTRVGTMRGYGRYVIIAHDRGYVTVYSHMGTVTVREGQKLKKDQVIGTTFQNRLHFQIARSGKMLNPLNHLPKAPATLTRR